MSSDRSAYDLFDRTLLRVPDYQRGYAWELAHLEEFWEDLSVLPAHAKHYTGTVVLHPRGGHDVRDDAGVRHRVVEVVDGQQRLTSVVLLLNELRRKLAQTGAELEAQKLGEQYVWIRKGGSPQAVLTLGRDIDPFWQRCVLADQPPFQAARLRSEARLLAARRFFEERLGEISRGDAAPERLRELHDTVTDRLRFTLYEVDDQAQVGVIFETLNDRGKPLTELEKAKNYLLFLASGLEPGRRRSLSEEVNTTWAHVYERLMEADITDPREEDRFLRAHWLMAIDPVRRNWDGTASLKSRFPRQRLWADPDALMDEVGGYVRELADAARAFCDTRRPTADGAFPEFSSGGDEVRDWSERLRRVGALASFTPLLLAVRLRHRGEAELYREVVELCEKFAFRVYRLRGVRANSGQGRLFSLAYDVYTGTETAEGMLHRLRDAIAAWSPRPMFEREFEALGDERNWYAWAGLRYFLYEHERALTGRRPVRVDWGEVERRPREETIEHILPQSPRDGEWLAFDEEARKVYTHDLGNLVLTFDNSSYSNKSFLEKRDGNAGGDGPPTGACFARSPLLQEQRIAEHADWTPDAVLARRSELIAWARERWAVEGDAPLDPEAEAEDVEDPAEELDA